MREFLTLGVPVAQVQWVHWISYSKHFNGRDASTPDPSRRSDPIQLSNHELAIGKLTLLLVSLVGGRCVNFVSLWGVGVKACIDGAQEGDWIETE